MASRAVAKLGELLLFSAAKAIGRAGESLLEDVGKLADGVSAKTKQGREVIGNVGMGRPKELGRRRKRARPRAEEEE